VRSSPSKSPDEAAVAAAAGWLRIEVDAAALRHNAELFRRLIPAAAELLVVVKANAYGHGLLLAAREFLAGGADRLGVHSIEEAHALRAGGVEAPIMVLGPLTAAGFRLAADLDVEVTVASLDAGAAAAAAAGPQRPLRVHVKVETGVNRQGIVEGEVGPLLEILAGSDGVEIVGLSSHFADIEDTTDHGFARSQSERFAAFGRLFAARGHAGLKRHMSCSAAAILWENGDCGMVRVGVSAYGVWPSRETLVSSRAAGRDAIDLRPAMAWKTAIAQVRRVPAGETVGYGRAWKAPADSRIAVLPVGYSEGYPRGLSGRAHVLVRGRRAPVVGRICMNLCMVDVSHVPGAAAGDEVVLLGSQGDETVSAEQIAGWLGTIPYEVLTLPGSAWRRVAV